MSHSSGNRHVAIGLARESIYGTYVTARPLVDEVDVRVLAVRGGDGPPAVLAVADVCNLWESTCIRLRDRVARALGVPVERVGITATQNHSAEFELGDDRKFDHDKLDRAFVDCARRAAATAQPVQVARVARRVPNTVISGRLSVEGFDPFIVYYGYRVVDGPEGRRADGSHVVKLALNSLQAGHPFPVRAFQVSGAAGEFDVPDAPIPVPTPLFSPPAPDDLLQALFFRRPDGSPVGSIIRFAVHPIAANRSRADWQSGDLCAYARRQLEARFGGTSIYLTGPSQSQYPLVGAKSLELAGELGGRLADEALAGLADAPWTAGGPVSAGSRDLLLPRRSDVPASMQAARDEQAALEDRFKRLAAAGPDRAGLAELKKLGDRYQNLWLFTGGQLCDWTPTSRDDATQSARPIRRLLFAMRIGPTVIASWPGESDGAWGVRLRDQTLGDDLILLERTTWSTYGESAADGGDPDSDPDRDLADATRELIAGLMRQGA